MRHKSDSANRNRMACDYVNALVLSYQQSQFLVAEYRCIYLAQVSLSVTVRLKTGESEE